MPSFFRLCLIGFLLLINNSSHSLTVSQSGNHYSNSVPGQKNLKPSKAKGVLYKLVQKLLIAKKSKSGIAIAFGILSVLLLSFLLFALAYGGAPGGILVLLGAVGIALIVFGLIKISRTQKSKRQKRQENAKPS